MNMTEQMRRLSRAQRQQAAQDLKSNLSST